jgi:hypothetical protein
MEQFGNPSKTLEDLLHGNDIILLGNKCHMQMGSRVLHDLSAVDGEDHSSVSGGLTSTRKILF